MLSSEECGIRISVSVSIAEALKLSPPKGLELFAKGMKKETEGRYEAIAAVTSLKRSKGWKELGASSLEQLAKKVAGISDHVLYDMLRVGKALLRNPEVDLSLQERKALVVEGPRARSLRSRPRTRATGSRRRRR